LVRGVLRVRGGIRNLIGDPERQLLIVLDECFIGVDIAVSCALDESGVVQWPALHGSIATPSYQLMDRLVPVPGLKANWLPSDGRHVPAPAGTPGSDANPPRLGHLPPAGESRSRGHQSPSSRRPGPRRLRVDARPRRRPEAAPPQRPGRRRTSGAA